jgi:hypothetical protein
LKRACPGVSRFSPQKSFGHKPFVYRELFPTFNDFEENSCQRIGVMQQLFALQNELLSTTRVLC